MIPWRLERSKAPSRCRSGPPWVTNPAPSRLPRMPHALAISAPRATAELLHDRRVRTALARPAILLQPSNQLTRTQVTQVSTSLSTRGRSELLICHHLLGSAHRADDRGRRDEASRRRAKKGFGAEAGNESYRMNWGKDTN